MINNSQGDTSYEILSNNSPLLYHSTEHSVDENGYGIGRISFAVPLVCHPKMRMHLRANNSMANRLDYFFCTRKEQEIGFLLCMPSMGKQATCVQFTACSFHMLIHRANNFVLFSNFKKNNLIVNAN